MISTVLYVIGLIAMAAAVVLAFVPRCGSPLVAFVSLLLLHLSYRIAVPPGYLAFWGIAAAIAAAIQWLSPAGEPDGRRVSNVYIALGAIAGCLLGILLAPRVMVLGVILGAAMGQMAYASTPAGRWLKMGGWPVMARYYAAKCLPPVVALAILGVAVMGFLS